MKKPSKKKLPKFKNEESERVFWQQADSTEYLDWSQAERASFPALKPSLKSISIRLPESMVEQLKTIANKRDVPYQSLMKMYLSEKVRDELNHV
jgi:predicted DNA binding CopG/RHH family protein